MQPFKAFAWRVRNNVSDSPSDHFSGAISQICRVRTTIAPLSLWIRQIVVFSLCWTWCREGMKPQTREREEEEKKVDLSRKFDMIQPALEAR